MKILKKYFKNSIYLIAAACFSPAFAGSYDDFFKAIDLNDAPAVQALLQRGFDANSRDAKGQTGLFLALRGGAVDVADLLIRAPNLDVNALNEAGESALMMAALKGQAALTQRLIDRGAAIDKAGWAPLHYAATGPDPSVVKLLLDRGAPIDARSPNGSTPLMMAAQYGSEANAALLLQRGADARLRNDRGLTAVDFAKLAHREALAASLERAQR
jgi:hypothetical protein